MAELIFNAVLGIVLVGYLVLGLIMKRTDDPTDVLGAGGFPVIVGAIALVVLVAITVKLRRNREGERAKLPMFDLKHVDGRAALLNLILLALYIGLLDVIGFTLDTFLYLPAAALAMGYRKKLNIAIFTVIMTTVIILAFGKLFFVPLPRGLGFLRELSFILY
ncbi:MAG TPA: tripartite tricarboxylate transporter TctB family protein [Rectinemataceae bacterium]|nr:tripartite tricarboxylate transporter TctB family protein [Rectinemataceae bacterium]